MTEGVEVRQEPQLKSVFRVPYCEATLQDISRTIPDSKEGMKVVLSEINRQCVENFSKI